MLSCVPPVAKVEPITTARALRGPFDYLRPDGVGVGSVLVVPFGHRDVVGVVVGLAERSELADDRLVAPRRVLDHDLPPELVELAVWMADEYCSTPARALALVSPPAGRAGEGGVVGGRGARCGGRGRGGADAGGGAGARGAARGAAASRALSERQRALLDDLRASGPRPAGGDLPALRRLDDRGLVTLERRAVRRYVTHDAVGARRAQPPPLTPDQARALAEVEAQLARDEPEPLLLHGVTGSGKTEIYLRAAATALERGPASSCSCRRSA